ncbi:MAG TPA: argininosuccinate lyase, partial [Burkholderiaceae bacterium]|nr:argininosuccinate lyase [Burkholderiaceae bacterium]
VEVDANAMRRAAEEGYSTATDLADYLVKKGVPFRDAHEAVARAVKSAASRDLPLSRLSLTELQTLSSTIGDDVFDALSVDGSVAARNHPGGTAPQRVRAQVAVWRQRLTQRAK